MRPGLRWADCVFLAALFGNYAKSIDHSKCGFKRYREHYDIVTIGARCQQWVAQVGFALS